MGNTRVAPLPWERNLPVWRRYRNLVYALHAQARPGIIGNGR
jgi:hypothetical protein